MEQSTSLKSDSSSASQELSHILLNTVVHYQRHNIPPLVPVLHQVSTVHVHFPIFFLKIRFKIILPFTRSCYKWPASFPFAHPNPVCTSPTRAKCPTHVILLNSVTEVISGEELFLGETSQLCIIQ